MKYDINENEQSLLTRLEAINRRAVVEFPAASSLVQQIIRSSSRDCRRFWGIPRHRANSPQLVSRDYHQPHIPCREASCRSLRCSPDTAYPILAATATARALPISSVCAQTVAIA